MNREETLKTIKDRCKQRLAYPKKGLHCLKCDTWYEAEERKTYEAGVLCPECKSRGYIMVGVCHLESLSGKDISPEERAALEGTIAVIDEAMGSVAVYGDDVNRDHYMATSILDAIINAWKNRL